MLDLFLDLIDVDKCEKWMDNGGCRVIFSIIVVIVGLFNYYTGNEFVGMIVATIGGYVFAKGFIQMIISGFAMLIGGCIISYQEHQERKAMK